MRAILFPLMLSLAACQDGRPPAPTAAEDAELDQSEAMLDDLAKKEGAADRSASPSDRSDNRE